MHVLHLFWAPGEEFRRLSAAPAYLHYLIPLAVGTYIIAFIIAPFVEAATIRELSATIGVSEARQILQEHAIWQLVGILLTPLALFVKVFFYAGVAWAFLVLCGQDTALSNCFSVILAASVIFILEGLTSGVVLHLRQLWVPGAEGNLSTPLGLDLLFTNTSPFLSSILGNLNLFEAWYFGLLLIGFRQACRASALASWSTAAFIWAIGVVAEAELQSYLARLQQAFS